MSTVRYLDIVLQAIVITSRTPPSPFYHRRKETVLFVNTSAVARKAVRFVK